MISQKDVAKRANVSTATVSAVINGNKFVSEKLKRKVLKAVKELNYLPDGIARKLAKNEKSSLVALFINDIKNYYYSELSNYVEEEVKKRNYNLIICNTKYSDREEKYYIDFFLKNRVAGLIIATPLSSDENIEFLMNIKFPFVLLGPQLKLNRKIDSISIDDFKAAKKAVNYLIKKGHKKIAYISGPKVNNIVVERLKGYLNELRENSIEINKDYIFENNNRDMDDFHTGIDAAKEILKLQNKPTAIFAYNDITAIGVMELFEQRDCRVPDDFSIIGIDDISISKLKMINLTTIKQPTYNLSVKAVEILFERMQKKNKSELYRYLFDTEIIERSSVKDIS